MTDETGVDLYKPKPVVVEPWELPRRAQLRGVDAGLDIAAFWAALVRHRRSILIICLVALAISALVTLSQKTIYEAEVLLEIEAQTPNVPRAQDLFTTDVVSDVYLETQYKLLNSNVLAEQVVGELGLDRIKEFQPSKWWWFWWNFNHGKKWSTEPSVTPAAYEKTLDLYHDQLNVVPIRRSRLVAITFDSQDPNLAARVVNTLSQDYLRKNLTDRVDTSKQASEALARELSDVSARLRELENELHKYASANDLLFLEIGGGTNENLVYERLRLLQAEVSQAEAARFEKESVYKLVASGDYASLPGVYQDKLIQDLSLQLATLQEQRAQLTATFNENYPKVKQTEDQIRELETALTRERGHAADRITKDYIAAAHREALVRGEWLKLQDQANHIADRLTGYNALKREVEVSKNMYDGLLRDLKDAAVSPDLRPREIRIVDSAKPPHKAIKPRAILNVGLGMVLGVLLGVAAAVLKERNDKSFKSPEEVEHYLRLPLLASVPPVSALENGRYVLPSLQLGPELALVTNGNHRNGRLHRPDEHMLALMELSEAFRGLCVSLFHSTSGPAVFPTNGNTPKSVLISSARGGEGRTLVAVHLATTLAELGHEVLLVDADMRHPSVHKVLNVPGDAGLATYLAGEEDWRTLVRPTRIRGLHTLPSGLAPRNPVELVSSARARRFVEEATENYKHVIFDSPSLLDVSDGRILASFVDGVILVVKSGATERVLVQRAESFARIVGARLFGVVLNNFDWRDHTHSQIS